MSSLITLEISAMHSGLNIVLGEGQKQYCLHRPNHLICPRTDDCDFDRTFQTSVLPVHPMRSNSRYLLSNIKTSCITRQSSGAEIALSFLFIVCVSPAYLHRYTVTGSQHSGYFDFSLRTLKFSRSIIFSSCENKPIKLNLPTSS